MGLWPGTSVQCRRHTTISVVLMMMMMRIMHRLIYENMHTQTHTLTNIMGPITHHHLLFHTILALTYTSLTYFEYGFFWSKRILFLSRIFFFWLIIIVILSIFTGSVIFFLSHRGNRVI